MTGPLVLALRYGEIHLEDHDEAELRAAHKEYLGPCPCCGKDWETKMELHELQAFFRADRAMARNDKLELIQHLEKLAKRVVCDECAKKGAAK